MSGGRVDWDAVMRLGLGRLGLAPAVFWAMTPMELQRALEGAGVVALGGVAPDRATLEALIAAFPDGGTTTGRESDDADG